MSNALYDFGRNEFMLGHISWDTDEFRLVMFDGTNSNPSYKHVTNQATDENLDDITSAGRVADSGTAMTAKTPDGTTSTAGVADAANVTFSGVSQANSQKGDEISIYKYVSGSEATSRLLVNIDTATGLPVTPNGGDITVQWDSGANKIFKL
jgi:hypothetical protein